MKKQDRQDLHEPNNGHGQLSSKERFTYYCLDVAETGMATDKPGVVMSNATQAAKEMGLVMGSVISGASEPQ